jgi:hypothetical protein
MASLTSDRLGVTLAKQYLKPHFSAVVERVDGIEPTSLAWKARALPLSYTRTRQPYSHRQILERIGGGGRIRTYVRYAARFTVWCL